MTSLIFVVAIEAPKRWLYEEGDVTQNGDDVRTRTSDDKQKKDPEIATESIFTKNMNCDIGRTSSAYPRKNCAAQWNASARVLRLLSAS
jgi:hypothetical protein